MTPAEFEPIQKHLGFLSTKLNEKVDSRLIKNELVDCLCSYVLQTLPKENDYKSRRQYFTTLISSFSHYYPNYEGTGNYTSWVSCNFSS